MNHTCSPESNQEVPCLACYQERGEAGNTQGSVHESIADEMYEALKDSFDLLLHGEYFGVAERVGAAIQRYEDAKK